MHASSWKDNTFKSSLCAWYLAWSLWFRLAIFFTLSQHVVLGVEVSRNWDRVWGAGGFLGIGTLKRKSEVELGWGRRWTKQALLPRVALSRLKCAPHLSRRGSQWLMELPGKDMTLKKQAPALQQLTEGAGSWRHTLVPLPSWAQALPPGDLGSSPPCPPHRCVPYSSSFVNLFTWKSYLGISSKSHFIICWMNYLSRKEWFFFKWIYNLLIYMATFWYFYNHICPRNSVL